MENRTRATNSKSLNYLFPGGLGRGEGRQRIVSPDERVDEYKEDKVQDFFLYCTRFVRVVHLRFYDWSEERQNVPCRPL